MSVLPGKRGSTLVWVMVTAIIMVLITTMVATIITVSTNLSANSRVQTQAYYTARTVSERVTNWLAGTAEYTSGTKTDQQKFIEALAATTDQQSQQSYDLGTELGTADVVISLIDAQSIDILATGYYGKGEETVTSHLVLTTSNTFTHQDLSFAYADAGSNAQAFKDVNDLATWKQQSQLAYNSYRPTTAQVLGTLYDPAYTANPQSQYGKGAQIKPSDEGNQFATLNVHAFDNRGTFPDYNYLFLAKPNPVPNPLPALLVNLDFGLTPITHNQGDTTTSVDATFPSSDLPNGSMLMIPTDTSSSSGMPYSSVTYYTLDDAEVEPGSLMDITMAPWMSDASVMEVMWQEFSNLNFYFDDTSSRIFHLASGLELSDSIIYTKRSAFIGGETSDTNQEGLANGERYSSILDSTLIFADPGEGQAVRHSKIGAWTPWGATNIEDTEILVQNRHSLTIGPDVSLLLESKRLVVESGGEVILAPGSLITSGSIYIQNGGRLVIQCDDQAGASLYVDVHCAGELVLDGGAFSASGAYFVLDTPSGVSAADAPSHGIFLYNHPTIGVASLTLQGDSTPYTFGIKGTKPGSIHSFVPIPGIAGTLANNIFDSQRDKGNNVTTRWNTTTKVWSRSYSS
ncbi:MAG: hypothetical protein LBU07_02590 [Coriobacteriales bacterium]|nr:hypothetical protein [Coriobacteriales bacterium]